MANDSDKLTVVQAVGEPAIDQVRELLRDYAADRGFDLSFQDFQHELIGLPGQYALPHGRLLLACVDGQPVGCAALRRIAPNACELKHLYIRPESRGQGIGRQLAVAAIEAARQIGYRHVRLDITASMSAAISLSRSLGFRELGPHSLELTLA